MKKTLYFLMLTVFCLILLSGCAVTKHGNAEYVSENDTYTLKSYKDTSSVTVFTVPDEIDGIPVTAIAKHGLSNSDYLTEIIIGDNISHIDSWAIRNNSMLEKITVSENNAHYKSVNGVLFSKDMKTLIAFPNRNAEKYVIPEGVETVWDTAFYKCGNLKEVTLASTVKTIGKMSFLKCVSLERIILNEGLQHIGDNAFLGCNKLTSLSVPASIESIGEYAFYNCVNLLEINVGKAEKDIALGNRWYPTRSGQNIRNLAINFAG